MKSVLWGTLSGLALCASAANAASIDLTFLGVTEIPSGTEFEGTTLGGLSGVTYDAAAGNYVAVSDDRGSDTSSPRVYTLDIDLSDGSLDDGDVAVTSTSPLLESDGTTDFVGRNPDPEGIALAPSGNFFISSERNAEGRFPQIFEFSDSFTLEGELDVDEKFEGNADDFGVGNNVGFESLTITPDGTTLFTATEAGLEQDGGRATLTEGADARIISYDLASGDATAEYVYQVEPIAVAPDPADAFADSGLVELLALDGDTLLALERSFSIGAPDRGFTGRLFEISLDGATNVIDDDTLGAFVPVEKELLADLGDFGIVVDNIEGMTFGEDVNGMQSLIIVSDDNFSAFSPQANQFIAFAIEPASATPIIPLPASGTLLLAGLGLFALRRR